MKRVFLLFMLLSSLGLTAQIELPVPRDIEISYLNGIRDKSGKPGVNYWQNHASYDINIRFDPTSRMLEGR